MTRSSRDPRRAARPGIALPLALFVLLFLTLLVALVLDAAVAELRLARGELASATAQARAESTVADLLTTPADVAWLALPRGAARVVVTGRGGDTARVVMQSLGGGLARVVATARSWSAGVRADAGTIVLLRAEIDSTTTPAVLHFRHLPGWWWTPLP